MDMLGNKLYGKNIILINATQDMSFTFTFTLVKVGKILEGYRANYKLKILTKYTKTIIKSFN